MNITLNMSESRERLIKQLSSSIFSPDLPSKEIVFKPAKRLIRDHSAESFSHGMKLYNTPKNTMLKPLDHSTNDFFGDSKREFYKRNLQNFSLSAFKENKKQEEGYEKNKKITVKPLKENLQVISQKENINISYNRISASKSNFQLKTEEKLQESSQNYILPKPEEARIENLMIKGLRSIDDEISIKELCHGMHIVEIIPEIDNVTGFCLGSAQVKIRSYPNSSSLDKFKTSLLKKGLELSYISLSNGKKNNYHCTGRNFLDCQLQQEEKRLVCNNLTSSERKRVILGTSDDLFGNSPGTGKWESIISNVSELKESRETMENLRKWEKVRGSNSKSPIGSKRISNFGFLKPTMSSMKKDISYKD